MTKYHPLSNCQECSHSSNNHYITTKHPRYHDTRLDSDILVVGDSPNQFEKGKWFSGNSWQLLNLIFKKHKISEDRISYTYGLPCSFKDFKMADIKCCRPRLFDKFKDYKYVLLLGSDVKKIVLDNKDYTWKQYGWWFYCKEIPGVKFLYTIKPATVLLGTDGFKTLDTDIAKLAKPELQVKWENPRITVANSLDEVHEFSALTTGSVITVDVETEVNKEESFTHPKAILSIGIATTPMDAFVIPERFIKPATQAIRNLLDNNDLNTQNGKFDVQVLFNNDLIPVPHIFDDTMLMSYSLDERKGRHSLDFLSMEHLGAPNYSKDIEPYIKKAGSTYRDIPPDKLWKYNGLDAICTHRLNPILHEKVDSKLYNYLIQISNTLAEIELQGIHVDTELLEEKITAAEKQLFILTVRLKAYDLENPNSPQQVKKVLQKLGLKNIKSTEADILKAYAMQHKSNTTLIQFINTLLEYKTLEKLYSTYLKGIESRLVNGFVYPTYLIHGTVFGRLSARNPNIQNQPRQGNIKELYTVSNDANTLIQCDYSQAELRVIACEAEDKYLQQVFGDRTRDIHGEVSDMVYGKDKWNKEQRVRTKAFVFGSVYDREASSIAQEFNMELHEASHTQRTFFDLIPDTMAWRKRVIDSVLKEKKVMETPFGRKRRFLLITNQNRGKIIKEILAFYPQSIASDLGINSTIKLQEIFRQYPDVNIRNMVHDSILVECPKDQAEDIALLMRRTMESVPEEKYSDFVPFKVDIEQGPDWGHLQ